MSSKNPIFKEPFTVEEIDAKGKFFSRGTVNAVRGYLIVLLVSRIEAKNESFNLDLKIDINIDLYTMKKGQVLILSFQSVTQYVELFSCACYFTEKGRR